MFLAAGMEWLVRTFAGNFLYGYSGYSAPETFAFLSPAWELVCVLDVSNVARVDRILSDGTYQVIRGGEYMLSGLGVLGIYAAVGIVLAVLGLLVYRRRASEATGSIVTVAWARPIFKYGVAVCAAFSLGQLIYFLVFGLNLHNGQYSLPGTIACMLFTGLLGYFAAEMLLHKSFRVWRTGRVGALVFSAVLVCFGVAMSLDLTGYEGYTPDAEEVEFVSVYLSSNGDYLSCKLDEPESIERTLAAHRAMIADKARQLSYARTTYETPADAPVDSYLYFTVTYTLTDGRVVRRSYVDCRAFSRELNEPGSVAQTMTALLNCPEAALDRVLGELADDKSNAYLTGGYYDVVSDGAYGEDDGELTSAQANTLVSALRRDYEAGHASNASLFEDTLYSGSFYVELELWYSIREDEKPTRPVDRHDLELERQRLCDRHAGDDLHARSACRHGHRNAHDRARLLTHGCTKKAQPRPAGAGGHRRTRPLHRRGAGLLVPPPRRSRRGRVRAGMGGAGHPAAQPILPPRHTARDDRRRGRPLRRKPRHLGGGKPQLLRQSRRHA